MPLGRLCSALIVVCALGSPAWAQVSNVERVRATNRVVIGGSTFGDVLRIVGSSTVSSGTGTMNPFILDADGDGLEDSNTTVSTSGAWNWTVLGTFGAGLSLTGNLTPGSGTLPIVGGLSTTGDVAINGNDLTSTGVLTVRPTGSLTLDPTGDIIIDPDGNDFQPLTNYTVNMGASNKKFLSFWAAEAWFDVLVASDVMSTIGGRVLVGPTSSLLSDLAAAGTTLRVKHNAFRVGDFLRLEANFRVEFAKVTAGPTRVTSGCGTNPDGSTIAQCFDYTVTRNHDTTGANDWTKGDGVFGGCARVGDGCLDLTSLRGAWAIGTPDEVLADAPEVYYRLNETSGTSVADATGHGYGGAVGGTAPGWAAGTTAISDGGGSLSCGGVRYVDSTASSLLTPLNGTATYAIWFAVSGNFSAGYYTILSKGTSWSIDINNSGELKGVHNGSEVLTLLNAGALADNGAWNHLVVARDSATSEYKVYVNGALVKTTAYTLTPTSNSTPFRVCSISPTPSQTFNGWADDVAVWVGRTLTADEVSQQYAARGVATRTVYRAGPTIDFMERTGTDFEDVLERATVGNLEGRFGYTSKVYGAAFGDPSATWVAVDASNGFRIMSGSTEKLKADTSGNLSMTGDLTIGTSGIFRSAAATALGTGTGIYMAGGTTPTFRVGVPSGNQIKWDGTDLTVKSDDVSIDANGIVINGVASASAWAPDKAYRFDFGDGNDNGLSAYLGGGSSSIVSLNASKNGTSAIILSAQHTSNTDGTIIITSHNSGNPSRIDVNSERVYVNGTQTFTGSCASGTYENGLLKSCP